MSTSDTANNLRVPTGSSEHYQYLIGNVKNKVSLFALDKIRPETVFIKDCFADDSCTCALWVHYGLPCRHRLPRDGQLVVEDFHSRWNLNRDYKSEIKEEEVDEKDGEDDEYDFYEEDGETVIDLTLNKEKMKGKKVLKPRQYVNSL